MAAGDTVEQTGSAKHITLIFHFHCIPQMLSWLAKTTSALALHFSAHHNYLLCTFECEQIY